MKLIIRNSISLLLSLVVLVTTSGFTVFKHHCTTENTSQLSFMIEDFDCDHNDHEHDSLPLSCCTPHGQDTEESCEPENCCDTESYVVMLNITLDKQEASKYPLPDLGISEDMKGDETLYPHEENDHIIISNDLPPPLAGKALRIYLHQLNIPFASV